MDGDPTDFGTFRPRAIRSERRSRGTDLAQSDDTRISRDERRQGRDRVRHRERHRASPRRGRHHSSKGSTLGILSEPRRSSPLTVPNVPFEAVRHFLPLSLPPPSLHLRSRPNHLVSLTLDLVSPSEPPERKRNKVVGTLLSWKDLGGQEDFGRSPRERPSMVHFVGTDFEPCFREASGGSCFQDGLWAGPENPTASEVAGKARTTPSRVGVSWGSPRKGVGLRTARPRSPVGCGRQREEEG